MLQQLWGRRPGMRGSSRTRSSRNAIGPEYEQADVDVDRRTGVLPH